MTEAKNPADYFLLDPGQCQPEGSAPPPAGPAIDPQVAELLKALAEQNRELILLSRRQLEVSQRMEERYVQQMQAQREEFVRWAHEIPVFRRVVRKRPRRFAICSAAD